MVLFKVSIFYYYYYYFNVKLFWSNNHFPSILHIICGILKYFSFKLQVNIKKRSIQDFHYIYIYIEREREREREINIKFYIWIIF